MTKTVATFLALAIASPALAQSDPSLPATDSTGADIVVTASRSGDAVRTDLLGASVTVLDADTLARRQTRIVSDILRDVPGVAVSRSGGVGGFTQLRLRGTESNHVLVLIDGIEVADPFYGEFDFGTMIADEAARIEVLRGQQSALYGSDAIGGVIQYLTETGREAPGFSARAEGGSFATAAGGARAAGVAGDLDYAVSGSLYRTDGTPTARNGTRDVGDTSAGATAKLNWTPSPVFKLTAVGRYSSTEALSNNTGSNPASPLFGLIVDSPGVRYFNRAFYGLGRGELTLLDGALTAALTGQFADTHRRSYQGTRRDGGDQGGRLKGSGEVSYRFGSDAVRHKLTGAIDWERETFENTTPSTFVFKGQRDTHNVGIVGQYELTVNDAASFGASVRRDENTRFADVTTFRLQGSYKLGEGTRVRAAYGTGIKNPGYYELYGYSDGRYIGNPNLKPERSKGWEAGVEQRIAGKSTIGATYFDSRLEDEIFTTYPAPTYVATPANRTTLSRQHGVEAFATLRPADQVRVDLAYTYLRARENGAVEVRRPKSIASANVTGTTKDGRFSGTLTVRYNGRMSDVAYTNPSYVPVPVSLHGYTLVNLNAELRLLPAVSLYGRVENLFDRRYEEVFSFAAPGRSAIGGIKVRL